MTTSAAPSLRVGIVIAGQLVEERTFDGATPITFGRSLRCALSVPLDGLPREHVLARFAHGRWTLHAPEGATLIGDVSRGRLTIGDVTVLVQQVVKAPRMVLPAGLKLSLMDRVDRRLAVIIAGSLAVHVGIAVTAWLEDVEQPSFATPYVATTYRHDMIDVTVPDTAIAPPVSTQGASTPVAPSAQTSRPIVRPTRITTDAAPVDGSHLATALTFDGNETPRKVGDDLKAQIDAVRDGDVTIGDPSRTSRTDDRVHVDTDTRPVVDDPNLTRTPPQRRDEPTGGRVIPGQVKPEDWTTLTPATVLDRINTVYMAGLQRCYRFGLMDDSQLSGRVSIRFTVDERGKVIDPDASGVSPMVDSCIQKHMGTWRFPIPKDKDGDATDATFAVSLALQPS